MNDQRGKEVDEAKHRILERVRTRASLKMRGWFTLGFHPEYRN